VALRAARTGALLLALSCGAGCAFLAVGGGVAMPARSGVQPDTPNLAVARRFFQALGSRDTETIAELYADDIEVWVAGSLPFSGSYNREQAIRGVEGLHDSFPDGLEFTIKGVTEQRDRIALEVESRGVHVSGKAYHNQYHYLLIIRDGKIHGIREYLDTLHAQQVIVEGAPPPQRR
jgi:hypothetical protein